MSDNPLDKVPVHNRVSVRAVLVHEGEDASAALAEAGFAETVSVPVVLGEQPDLSGGILGNGITPNVVAVLETEEGNESGASSDVRPRTAGPRRSDVQSAGPVTTMLPGAFGMRPLAPVRPHNEMKRIAEREAGGPPKPSAFPDWGSSSLGTRPGPARTTIDRLHRSSQEIVEG